MLGLDPSVDVDRSAIMVSAEDSTGASDVSISIHETYRLLACLLSNIDDWLARTSITDRFTQQQRFSRSKSSLIVQ